MTLKAKQPELPQIDAQFEHRVEPDYANQILDDLLDWYTLDQISAHSGICRRSLSYMRHRGIRSYPDQLALEVLSGYKSLVEMDEPSLSG